MTAEYVRRGTVVLRPDSARVISRPFVPGDWASVHGASRTDGIIRRILDMADDEVAGTLAATVRQFTDRHDDLPGVFAEHFALVADRIPGRVSAERRQLIGAYFTQEYSVEAAALFNPSIVAHPDQSGLSAGQLRFVMSARAVGEGHISSIEFRTGVFSGDDVRIDDPGRYLSTGRASGSRLQFDRTRPISERVIFPYRREESGGIEDARFTVFTDDDGSTTYYATYTAFDGSRIAPHLLRTDDFAVFDFAPMSGPAAQNKGMALFPRRVAGRFMALSRWDQESIGVASSVDNRVWGDPVTVAVPERPWELIQLGNCGSPIETSAGWLVLTHGVGPMRTYGIGAMLLDLADPTVVRGVLRRPLLTANEAEREGYVPNVVYSCGALPHRETLVLPYGCSDSAIRFAFVELPALLHDLFG